MNKRKTTLLALASAAVVATGCFFGASLTSNSFTKLMGATSSLYTAEITTSTDIIKIYNSQDTYAFQLHGGENYGAFYSKYGTNYVEIHDSGDYVLTLLPDDGKSNYLNIPLRADESGMERISATEYKMVYTFPTLQSITVTVDKDVTNCSVKGYSGAGNSFDASVKTEGDLKMYTLTRNSTPLPEDSSYGNYIMISKTSGSYDSLNIRSISLVYSC